MSPWFLLVSLAVTGADGAPQLKLGPMRSDVGEWPQEHLTREAARSLSRTAEQRDAGHAMAGPDDRGDVQLRGVLKARAGQGVRLTWQLSTQECPLLTDAVAYDFKSGAVTPAGLDAVSVQLAQRAKKLLAKAQGQRAVACISASGTRGTVRAAHGASTGATAEGATPTFTPSPQAPPLVTPIGGAPFMLRGAGSDPNSRSY